MDWTILVSLITSLFSAIAAVLAWAAKLRWSKEYAAAKDEVIKAKEAQIELQGNEIESLRELSPVKIREYFVSVKTQLEEFIDLQKTQLKDLNTEFVQILEEKRRLEEQIDSQKTQSKDIEQANVELLQAYDSTLEGWAFALQVGGINMTLADIRRIIDITSRLAQAMGMSEAELVHVRRGALLHDIGNLGILHNILNKPGQFTDDERQLMRRHPGIAYELLSPVAYLHASLDIPYCHHEKWDGTGYPRGLKGEQIPLAARIFAVVDVWDAMRSDRPYRYAWPEEKVREYIREQAGKHFDPQVVKAFLAIEQVM